MTKFDFPVWNIVDESLNEQARLVIETRQNISEVEKKIDKQNETIDSHNNQIEMFIKNITQNFDFNTEDDLIIIGDNNSITIRRIDNELDYDNQIVDKAQEHDKSYTITKKQKERLLELVMTCDSLINSYDELVDEFEDLIEYHDELMYDAEEIIIGSSLLSVYDSTSKDEFEQFDKDIHSLIILKEENSWSFNYIRKENVEEIYKD